MVLDLALESRMLRPLLQLGQTKNSSFRIAYFVVNGRFSIQHRFLVEII